MIELVGKIVECKIVWALFGQRINRIVVLSFEERSNFTVLQCMGYIV